MRVIAGQYRSRRLMAPPGTDTRPTSDRLRETLFNVLSAGIPESVWFDLFAGSGAVGMVRFATSPGFHETNSFSNFGVISANVVSPTISNVALFGLYQVSWNFARSWRVILHTLDSLPVLAKAPAYGCPLP